MYDHYFNEHLILSRANDTRPPPLSWAPTQCSLRLGFMVLGFRGMNLGLRV